MIGSYHVNPETGNVNKCSAKIQCDFEDGLGHYDTKERAQIAYEEYMETQQFSLFASKMKTDPEFARREMRVIHRRNFVKYLEEKYEESGQSNEITEEFYGFSPSSLELQQYNTDYRNLSKKLTDSEKEAMHLFTGIFYEKVNKYLYSEDKENFIFHDDDEINNKQKNKVYTTISEMDNYIAKAPKKQRRLFRALEQSIDTDKGAHADETFEGEKERIHAYPQQLEREIVLPRDMNFTVTKMERTRFVSDNGDSSEPLTVFLKEKE